METHKTNPPAPGAPTKDNTAVHINILMYFGISALARVGLGIGTGFGDISPGIGKSFF